MKLWVGTSGYSYKPWLGNLYPERLPAKDMLRFYASQLPAVEINNTFYRLPKEAVIHAWAEQVPAEFRFVLKASQRITHVKRLKDTADEVEYLFRVANALGSSQGAMLFQLPPTLRKANSTLVNLRATLTDARPLVRDARPVAPLLSDAFDQLRPFSRDARPVVARTRAVIDRAGTDADLLGVLERLVGLSRKAVPAFDSTVKTVEDALPIVREARPYVPDLIGGLMNGFGGTTAGYYDANGHYVRISFQGSTATLTGLGTLVPRPGDQQGLSGFRTGVNKRCPGAATQPAEDGSSPYIDTAVCDEEDTPR